MRAPASIDRRAGRAVLALWILLIFGAVPGLAHAAPRTPLDKTLASQLLALEQDNRPVPKQARALLEDVLTDAYAAAQAYRQPKTAAEFVGFAKSVSVALAKRNFIQPVLQKDWVASLGHAFEPIDRDDPRVKAYLADPQNLHRSRLVDRTKPFYFVDCDMAALIMISVAQMAGFELRLVHVPNHEFVRWQGENGLVANWDWTHWGSYDDAFYRSNFAISQAQINRRVYLASQDLAASSGYFIVAMSRKVSDPARKLELRRRAAPLSANEPVTASNVGWSFATTREGVTPDERNDALAYGLTGWAAAPDDAVHFNVVACAFAARRDFALAKVLQERAVKTGSADNLDRYVKELDRIGRGQMC